MLMLVLYHSLHSGQQLDGLSCLGLGRSDVILPRPAEHIVLPMHIMTLYANARPNVVLPELNLWPHVPQPTHALLLARVSQA